MRFLRRNTDAVIIFGPVQTAADLSVLDDAAAFVAANLALFKAGADGVQPTITGTIDTSGYTGFYKVSIPAVNWAVAGRHVLYIECPSGDVPITIDLCVLPELVYDSLIAGTDNLRVDVQRWADIPIQADATGLPVVNVTKWLGDVAPAIPANWSALGINASGHISRVTLVDAVTTVASKTGYELSSSGIDAIYNKARAGLAAIGTFGETFTYLAAAFSSSGVLSPAALANAPTGGGEGGTVELLPSLVISGPNVITKPRTGTVEIEFDIQAYLPSGAPLALSTGGLKLLNQGVEDALVEILFAQDSVDEPPLHYELVDQVTGARGTITFTLSSADTYKGLILQGWLIYGINTIIANLPVTVEDAPISTVTTQIDELRA